MEVSLLYDNSPARGQDVYIIGSGPSIRVFDTSFLKDKCCILLNRASDHLDLGPFAFVNNRGFINPNNQSTTIKVVKAHLKFDGEEREDNHVTWDHPEYYCFSYTPKDRFIKWNELGWTTPIDPLYYWNIHGGSVATFACQFALLAGAKSITLVGCDCISIGNRNYFTKKSSGPRRNIVYDGYRESLHIMQRIARSQFNVPVMTLWPFCGVGRYDEQLEALERELIKEGKLK